MAVMIMFVIVIVSAFIIRVDSDIGLSDNKLINLLMHYFFTHINQFAVLFDVFEDVVICFSDRQRELFDARFNFFFVRGDLFVLAYRR